MRLHVSKLNKVFPGPALFQMIEETIIAMVMTEH